MLNIKEFRSKDLALPDLLNPAILAGEIQVLDQPCAVLLNKDGSFLAALQYVGPDLESLSYAVTNRISAVFNAAIARLGSGWTAQVSAIRVPADGYIEENRVFFPDPVSALIDAERRMQFEQEGLHFLSRYYLVFTWQTPPESEVSAGRMFLESKKDAQPDTFDVLLQKFEDGIRAVVGVLKQRFLLSPLDAKGVLTHYHECLTGRSHGVNPPDIPAYLDVLLGHHDFVGGLEPSIDGELIEVITVTGYPDRTRPEMLEGLHSLPFPLRYTTRFILQDQQESKKLIAKYREKWASSKFSLRDYLSAAMDKGQVRHDRADPFKVAMEQETALADGDVSSGVVRLGYFTATVILRGRDAKALDDRARMVMDFLNNANFIAKQEKVNVVEAFLGSLPGHTWENVRRPVLNSMNFVDVSPKTAIWAGDADCPSPLMKTHGKPAPCLTYAQTAGSTPYRFNLHVGDVGHALIVGPTGAGKSTILALLAAQWRRHKGARVFGFESGRSLYTLCEAVGGAHYDIAGELSDLTFAPLAGTNKSQAERAWAEEWLEACCELQGMTIHPGERDVIHTAIEGLSQEEGRSLTDVRSLLQDEQIKAAIGFYTGRGRTGTLLDARADTLSMDNQFTIFEMEHLLTGTEQAKLITGPVLLYIFHRIEQMLDGRPTLITLDEGWLMLDNPQFLAKLAEWLVTLRKKNAAVVFATTSLSHLAKSPLLPILKEACPTKIFLPNVEAGSATLLPMYTDFGLGDKEIELLQTAVPKLDYYIRSPLGQRLVSFGMGPVALAFCAVSDPRDVKRVAELRDLMGPGWPVAWLRERLPVHLRDSWVGHLETLYRSF